MPDAIEFLHEKALWERAVLNVFLRVTNVGLIGFIVSYMPMMKAVTV